MALRARKILGSFEKRAPGSKFGPFDPEASLLTKGHRASHLSLMTYMLIITMTHLHWAYVVFHRSIHVMRVCEKFCQTSVRSC